MKICKQLQQLCEHVSAHFSGQLIYWQVFIGCFEYGSHPLGSFSFSFPLSPSSVSLLSHFFLPFLSFLLVMKARALHMLPRHSSTELHLQPLCWSPIS